MSKKTRTITLSALFSALCVVSLYFASVFPTGQLGLAAAASLFVAAAVAETGISSGVSVFIVSSALGMLLVPDRTAPLLYIMFFGYYPVVKRLVERIISKALQWIVKLIVFNASLTLAFFVLKELFTAFTSRSRGVIIMYIAGSAVFALFDYGYSKVILFYTDRISRRR